MSTNQSSADESKNDKKPADKTTQSGPPKKRKSPGFIETSGFKPSWLETGPLTPEILRDSLALQGKDNLFEEKAEQQTGVAPAPESTTKPAHTGEPSSEVAESTHTPHPISAEEHTGVQSGDNQPEAWVQALFTNGSATQSQSDTSAKKSPSPRPAAHDHIDLSAAAAHPSRARSEYFEPTSTAVDSAYVHGRLVATSKAGKKSRWTPGLLLTSLLLLGLAAITFFVNPFIRVAMNSATLAKPATPYAVIPPKSGSGNWCVDGDFLGTGDRLKLADSGNQGDILTGDGVFSLNYIVAQPGTYNFQVSDCDNPDLSYPATAAWLKTTQPNQQVTFVFDTMGRGTALFGAAPYIVNVIDDANDFRVIGNFQFWDENDASSRLEQLSGGLYQQVRHISAPGAYEAQFITNSANQSIDVTGRTDTPVSLTFRTNRPSEPVVFLLDTDRGQASVLYDMTPLLASLAFGNGYRLLSYWLLGLAVLLLLVMTARLLILNNNQLRMESGCPQCGQRELMRISRRPGQRLLNALGIPAYRYRCRNCTWEGTRLSDVGEAFSTGSLFGSGKSR